MKKIAVITGATSGIGLAAAKLFLKRGYTVYGIARKPYLGEDFRCYCADVRDYGKIDGIFSEIRDIEGRIDVLVNNAGFGIAGAVEDASAESIQAMTDVNLTAVCVICSMIVKYLKPNVGRIINVSSVGGIMPLPYQAVYSATKAGVEVFSRALSNELKPYNIKVVAVLPGDTRTNFTDARTFEGNNARAEKSIEKMSRDERRGVPPEKVAKVIYKAAERKNPPLRIAVGFVSKLEIFLTRILSIRFINFIIRKIYG